MARIGLIDVDKESRGKVTFPNLSLMKLASFHKPLGNSEFKVVCSVCGRGEKAKGNGYTAYYFCPWCGADMRSE